MTDIDLAVIDGSMKASLAILAGLLVSVVMLLTPKKHLANLGKIIDPDYITAFRLVLFEMGLVLFFNGFAFSGFLLIVIASILDIIDGKMAKYMSIYGIYRSAVAMAIGEWLDPIVDKLTILPALIIFAHLGILNWYLVIGCVALDVFGTVMRVFYSLAQYLKTLHPQKLQGYFRLRLAGLVLFAADFVRGNKAKGPGKIKALLQAFVLLACAPDYLGWTNELPSWMYIEILPNLLCSLALCFGLASVAVKLKLHHQLDKQIDCVLAPLEALFQHEDCV